MGNKVYRDFSDILRGCAGAGRRRLSVAVAQDEKVLEAVAAAEECGLAEAILVGDRELIAPMVERLGIAGARIVHRPDEAEAAREAVALVRSGEAEVLMKGLLNSSDFMRAVLDKDGGLKTGSLLSHLAVFEVPGQRKLQFYTDGGLNIAPDLAEKKGILINALSALSALGIENPKVAALSANEKVSAKMQSSVDAAALAEARASGEIPAGIVEGPIALDVAASPEAARHKGIESAISGDVDLYLVPGIDAGNMIGKTLVYFAGATMAGIILGAAAPVVLSSRSDTAEGKLYSIALASLVAAGTAQH